MCVVTFKKTCPIGQVFLFFDLGADFLWDFLPLFEKGFLGEY